MIGVNHVATGVLVATIFSQPALALPLALLSHFVIDAIPHWDYKIGNNVAYQQLAMMLDLTLSLSLLLILSVSLDSSTRLVIACGFLAALPDAMWLPYILKREKAPHAKNKVLGTLLRLHGNIQWNESSKGVYIEIIWFIATVALILSIGT